MTRFFESARADYVTFTLSYFIIFARGINPPHVCVPSQNNMHVGGVFIARNRRFWRGDTDTIPVFLGNCAISGICHCCHYRNFDFLIPSSNHPFGGVFIAGKRLVWELVTSNVTLRSIVGGCRYLTKREVPHPQSPDKTIDTQVACG